MDEYEWKKKNEKYMKKTNGKENKCEGKDKQLRERKGKKVKNR